MNHAEGITVSQVNHVINVLGGATRATLNIARVTGIDIGLTTIRNWPIRKEGIPPHWRYIIWKNADALGIKDPDVLEYLQPRDAI